MNYDVIEYNDHLGHDAYVLYGINIRDLDEKEKNELLAIIKPWYDDHIKYFKEDHL